MRKLKARKKNKVSPSLKNIHFLKNHRGGGGGGILTTPGGGGPVCPPPPPLSPSVFRVNHNASNDKSVNYRAKITGKTKTSPAQSGNSRDIDQPTRPPLPTLNVETTIPLKYFINFWRSLYLPLINCKLEHDLPLTKDFVLIEHNKNITCIDFKIPSTNLMPLQSLCLQTITSNSQET